MNQGELGVIDYHDVDIVCDIILTNLNIEMCLFLKVWVAVNIWQNKSTERYSIWLIFVKNNKIIKYIHNVSHNIDRLCKK